MIAQHQILEAIKKRFVLNGKLINNPEFIETNSSLILFTANNAFKIIKQEKGEEYFALKSRYFWLKEEFFINSEISPALYKEVVPVFTRQKRIVIGNNADNSTA